MAPGAARRSRGGWRQRSEPVQHVGVDRSQPGDGVQQKGHDADERCQKQDRFETEPEPDHDGGGVGDDRRHLHEHRKRLHGSVIGGINETQEMLDFCARKKVFPDIELINATQINEAYERANQGKVKFRFVIDAKTI